MEKVQNLLSFSDFEKSWNPKKQKPTKKTEIGLDVLEKRRMLLENDIEDDEFIDDDEDIIEDEDIESGDEDFEDEDPDEVDVEDEVWKEQLKSHIDQIIEDGVDPEEVYDFLDNIADENEGDEDEEDLGSENDDEEDDLGDEDLDDLDDEETFVEDEEGQDVQESVKSFRKWNR